MKLLITGGAGFIGSNLVKCALLMGHEVVNLDKLTYAGNLDSLEEIQDNSKYTFVQGDICDEELLRALFERHSPDAVMHLAAESHVDRSIDSPGDFIRTNVVGTYNLLHAALRYYEHTLRDDPDRGKKFRFLHVSTDEVFGTLGETGYFDEQTPYAPNSPYSASKASSDHLVRAWGHTFGLPVLITNCSNNYGPCQFPEKLIPHMIISALNERPLPVYGDGCNVRDWLFVEDHCTALMSVLERGRVGETYAVGGNNERTNLEIVQKICATLDQIRPRAGGAGYADLIAFVKDRPGHDYRYAIDASKIERELGWTPAVSFEDGMRDTVRWYLDHRDWSDRILSGDYRLARIGTKGAV